MAIPSPQDSLGERALVEAATAGNREAFGQLVRLHERVALRTALVALGSRADAEDVAQDAFLLAWRKLHAFRGRASFRTWLLTIVWRQALARRRSRQRWWERLKWDPKPGSRGQGWDETKVLVDLLASEALNPEESALARSLERQTARAIARLPPKLRDTLLFAASGEHSYEEIGRLLGVAVGTVKWRVSEARRLVSRAIEERP